MTNHAALRVCSISKSCDLRPRSMTRPTSRLKRFSASTPHFREFRRSRRLKLFKIMCLRQTNPSKISPFRPLRTIVEGFKSCRKIASVERLLAMAKADGSLDEFPAVLTSAEIVPILRIDRRSFYKLLETGAFPAPDFHAGPASPRWLKTSVAAWVGGGGTRSACAAAAE